MTNRDPFVNEVYPVRPFKNNMLVHAFRKMITENSPDSTYDNANIIAVRSGSGMNALRILNLPVSVYLGSIANERLIPFECIMTKLVQNGFTDWLGFAEWDILVKISG